MTLEKEAEAYANKQMLLQILQNQGAIMLVLEMELTKYSSNMIVEMNRGSLRQAIDSTSKLYFKHSKNKTPKKKKVK